MDFIFCDPDSSHAVGTVHPSRSHFVVDISALVFSSLKHLSSHYGIGLISSSAHTVLPIGADLKLFTLAYVLQPYIKVVLINYASYK